MRVIFVGDIYYADLSVGGGPIYPPIGGQPQPPGIWGPNDPRPTPPIVIPQPPPVISGPPGPWPTPPINIPGNPPGIWGPGGPWPTPPINLPGGGNPGNPPIIWGGGNVPMPNPPIHLGPGGEVGGPPSIGGGPIFPPPPGSAIPPSVGAPIEGSVVFVPGYGWVFIPKRPDDGAHVDNTLPDPEKQPK